MVYPIEVFRCYLRSAPAPVVQRQSQVLSRIPAVLGRIGRFYLEKNFRLLPLKQCQDMHFGSPRHRGFDSFCGTMWVFLFGVEYNLRVDFPFFCAWGRGPKGIVIGHEISPGWPA